MAPPRLDQTTQNHLEDLLDEFLALYRGPEGYSENTAQTYEKTTRRFLGWLGGTFEPGEPRR